jgi:gliding motility-associated-like protein
VRFVNAGGSPARWDFGDGTPAVEGAEVRHTYQQAGRFQPRVSLRYLNAQCETTAPLAAVEVLNQPIPNVITPNGDKDNQYFRLPVSCEPRLQVFSRWGQVVHDVAVYHNDWDATGHPAGLYYYLLTYPDGHRVKGWLEVMK